MTVGSVVSLDALPEAIAVDESGAHVLDMKSLRAFFFVVSAITSQIYLIEVKIFNFSVEVVNSELAEALESHFYLVVLTR